MKDKHVDDGGEREKKRAEGLLELGGVYIFRAKHRASPALAATPLVSSYTNEGCDRCNVSTLGFPLAAVLLSYLPFPNLCDRCFKLKI